MTSPAGLPRSWTSPQLSGLETVCRASVWIEPWLDSAICLMKKEMFSSGHCSICLPGNALECHKVALFVNKVDRVYTVITLLLPSLAPKSVNCNISFVPVSGFFGTFGRKLFSHNFAIKVWHDGQKQQCALPFSTKFVLWSNRITPSLRKAVLQ